MGEILLKTTPAFKIVLLIIAGFIIAAYIPIPTNIIFILISVFIVASLILLYVKKSSINIILDCFVGITVLLGAIIRYQIASDIFPDNHISKFMGLKQNLTIKGYVANFPVVRDSTITCEVKTEQILLNNNRFKNIQGTILLRCKQLDENFEKYDRILITGKLKKPRGERNPGEFNHDKYLKSIGIYGTISIYNPSNIQILPDKKEAWFLEKVISNCRKHFEQTIDRTFSDQNRALLKGLILGERGEITPEIKVAFSKTGVMHILAVSGLHVGFIVIIFSTLFKLLRIPYRATLMLTIVSTLFYMLLIGFKPPVVRATTIVGLYLIGLILQRRSNSLNLLATAAIIILMINPLELFQASFQLSFAAVLSILYFYTILNNHLSKLPIFLSITKYRVSNYIVQLLLVSFAVSCGTAPLTIYYFEKLPIIAVFINIIVIPLVGIIITLGFIYLVLSSFILPLSQIIATINIFFLNFLINFVIETAEISFSYIPIYGINLLHIFVIYLILFLIFNIDKRRYQKALVFFILIGMNVMVWRSIPADTKWMEVIFFDVGQGDAAFIRFPDHQTMIIDGGEADEYFNAGKRHVVPYLKRNGIKKLEAIMLSHADTDHLGGIPYVMRNLKVNRIIDNGVQTNSDLFKDYQFLIDSLGTNYQNLHTGDRLLEFSNTGIFVFHSGKNDPFDNLNNSSLVIKIVYDEVSFLFTGDIEKEVEERLLRYGTLLKSDVLKVPHHGSSTSSTLEFLELVKPKYAVISVGEYNQFQHPSKYVLGRLNQLGIETIRTDVNGAVIFRTDGRRLERTR